jgi:hypothetical protein
MPQIAVAMIERADKPRAVGEPGTPQIGPRWSMSSSPRPAGEPRRSLPVVRHGVAIA